MNPWQTTLHPALFQSTEPEAHVLELAWIRLNKSDQTLSLAWYTRFMGKQSTGMTTVEFRPRGASSWTPVFVPRPVTRTIDYEYWETVVDLADFNLSLPVEIQLRFDYWLDDKAAHFLDNNRGKNYLLGVSSPVLRHKVPAALLPRKVCLLQARAGDFLDSETLQYREGALQITALTDCWPSTIFARGRWADQEGQVRDFLCDLAPSESENRSSLPRVFFGEIALANLSQSKAALDWASFHLYVVSADGDTISEHPGPFGQPWKCFAGPPGFSTVY